MTSRDRHSSRDSDGTDDSAATSAHDSGTAGDGGGGGVGRAFHVGGKAEAWWSYGSRGGPPSALIPTHPNARYVQSRDFVRTSYGGRGFSVAATKSGTISFWLPELVPVLISSVVTLRPTITKRPSNPLTPFVLRLGFGFC